MLRLQVGVDQKKKQHSRDGSMLLKTSQSEALMPYVAYHYTQDIKVSLTYLIKEKKRILSEKIEKLMPELLPNILYCFSLIKKKNISKLHTEVPPPIPVREYVPNPTPDGISRVW